MKSEPSSIRVLHVDDDRAVTESAANTLEETDGRFEVRTVESAAAGVSYLSDHEIDCIVSDQDLPDEDGLSFLETVRESYPDIPFVLFTDAGSEAVASEAISAGVSDYVRKTGGDEQYELLATRIENAVTSYRKSRAAERAQRRLRELAENSNDILWIYEGEWEEMVFINSAYEDVWGQPVEALREQPTDFMNGVHPDDRDRVERAVERAANGQSLDLEFRVQGSTVGDADEGNRWTDPRWVWVQAEPIVIDGDVERIVGFTRDITDRRERERERKQYKRIVDAMGDGIYVIDERGRYVDVNEYLEALSGYDEQELQRKRPREFIDEEDVERFEATIADLLSGDTDEAVETIETTLHTADGDTIPIEVNLTLLPADGDEFRGTVGVVRDITERKERERELEQYETIVTAVPDEVYTIDAEGRFTSIIPPTGADLTTAGYDPEELIGEHVSALMNDDDIEHAERMISDLLSDPDRERASFEMAVVTKDGEHIPHENHIALLPREDGEFRGTVGVLRDITERKEREEELHRQNERLEEFVGVVSHDLRSPLNVARSRLEFVMEECDSEHLDHVLEAHDRMETLIDDLLTLAREGQGATELEPVALSDVVTGCWQTVTAGDGTLAVELDRTIRADRSRLKQLLENLLANAVDHGGPDVSVRVGAIDDGRTGFFVADDGPGVPSGERDRAFESGYSTAEGGTGFGLAIVKEIVDAHGWTVGVTESRDGGARFEITGVDVVD